MISPSSLQQLLLQICVVYCHIEDGRIITKPTKSQQQVCVCISSNTSVLQALLQWFKDTFEDQGFFLSGQSMLYLHLNSKIMILFPSALHAYNF